jgi:dTDP-4-dehydrorhamnose 3,5-epimerase
VEFIDGEIVGVRVSKLKQYTDDRGWLIETFRHDELDPDYFPVMGYTSLTLPGVSRGPHEHVDQADLFLFFGPGNFEMYLWDNRSGSPTYRHRQVFTVGEKNPVQVLVPKGVVHAYINRGPEAAISHNFPNQLYAGEKKREAVDEIRHEDDPNTPYQLNP